MSSPCRDRARAAALAVRLGMIAFVVTSALAGCGREKRQLRADPRDARIAHAVSLVSLHPGPTPPESAAATAATPVIGHYEETSQALSQGQQLFQSYNCSGCHANGGGGMGPALMDANWLYGSRPDQVYESIVRGRPNGMPAFAGRLPGYQVWQLVAYVRSLSGLVRRDAALARNDHMRGPTPPNSMPHVKPLLRPQPPQEGAGP